MVFSTSKNAHNRRETDCFADYGQIIAVTFSLKRAESDQLTSSLLKNGTLCNISLSDLTLEPVNVNVFVYSKVSAMVVRIHF